MVFLLLILNIPYKVKYAITDWSMRLKIIILELKQNSQRVN